MRKEKINIVWLKRDLRIRDHRPLFEASQRGLPTLILCLFEPVLFSLPQSSNRHWRFIYQSVEDLNSQGMGVESIHGDAQVIFESLSEYYDIQEVFSYQEVGLKVTYDRDELLRSYFLSRNIKWYEFPKDGIIRGKKNRIGWEEQWYEEMEKPLYLFQKESLEIIELPEDIKKKFSLDALDADVFKKEDSFQVGGEKLAQKELMDFVERKAPRYLANLSNVIESRKWGSRLSVYLSYGCISLKEVYQTVSEYVDDTRDGENYKKYLIRLFWRSHYIQKLETDWILEFEPTNVQLKNSDKEFDPDLFYAWAEGRTGYPLIDASIRCLEKTGFVNFRQRAMLVTFATFTLWQEWEKIAQHLARLFLDFEPGIHYGQIQLQSGLTGYHTLRLFNPILQSQKHDKHGDFIKKWLPQLKDLPKEHIHTPWKMNPEEQKKYNCILGKDYPEPIVDYEIATTIAKTYYWAVRNREPVLLELPEIFKKYCLPKNIDKYMESMEFNLREMRRNQRR